MSQNAGFFGQNRGVWLAVAQRTVKVGQLGDKAASFFGFR
jgi:hypothetical protein